jgi:hypothetical protein
MHGIIIYLTEVSKFAYLFPVTCDNGYSADHPQGGALYRVQKPEGALATRIQTLGESALFQQGGCGAPGTFRVFELCSICSRGGLGHSKPATNP